MAQTPALPYPNAVGRWALHLPVALYRMGMGGLLNTLHIMILVTRGRKSGLPRYTPVEYRRHGSKTYIVASWGERAQWVKNLRVTPHATAQQGSEIYSVCAHVVDSEGEKLRALHLFRRPAPAVYDALLARFTHRDPAAPLDLVEIARDVMIVRLEPQPTPLSLPALPTDLAWVLPAAGIGLIVLWGIGQLVRRPRP